MKVLVLGAGGMLGSLLVERLQGLDVPTEIAVVGLNSYFGNVLDTERLEHVRVEHAPDLVINCAGVLNAPSLVNSLGPWNVSRVFSCKIWHISTDCVLDSERQGRHWTHEAAVPRTEYGISKLMGEITAPHVSNLRTSFIGYRHGLLRWFLDLPRKSVIDGWMNAYWSGSTVYAVVDELVDAVITGRQYISIEHIATRRPIDKLSVLKLLRERFDRVDIRIEAKDRPFINRSMEATRALPSFPTSLVAIPEPTKFLC